MSWSGTLGDGAYWGLVRNIGPYKTTPEDVRRMNSQAGGPHAGHGNWMLTFNPHPYIQTERPSPMYKYYDLQIVTKNEDFKVPYDLKVPGIRKSGSQRSQIMSRSKRSTTKDIIDEEQSRPPDVYIDESGDAYNIDRSQFPNRIIRRKYKNVGKDDAMEGLENYDAPHRESEVASSARSSVLSMRSPSTSSFHSTSSRGYRPNRGYGMNMLDNEYEDGDHIIEGTPMETSKRQSISSKLMPRDVKYNLNL